MQKALLILFWLMNSWSVWAQQLNFYGVLPSVSQTGKISKRVDYNLLFYSTIDAFDRTINGVNYPARTLLLYVQPSLIYKVNRHLNVTVGYTYQRSDPFEATAIREFRPWQQVLFAHPAGIGRLAHRVRLEERFIENRSAETFPLSTRTRYLLDFGIPLRGRMAEPSEFYFHTFSESFFSLTGNRNAFFSEQWVYAGIGYDTGHLGKIEVGPTLQSGVRNHAGDRRNLFLLQVTWMTNFKLWN